MEFKSSQDNKELAYDLRQRRAKFIGDCIDDMIASMKADNFYLWMKSLEDLYDISAHMFSDKDACKEYDKIKKELVEMANKYKSTWLGTAKKPEDASAIEQKLRELTRFVLLKIEESGAFGTREYDEDEI